MRKGYGKKETARIRAAQMDNVRGVLGIKRTDRVQNEWIRELCRVRKGWNVGIDESVLRWLGHIERMGNDMIA